MRTAHFTMARSVPLSPSKKDGLNSRIHKPRAMFHRPCFRRHCLARFRATVLSSQTKLYDASGIIKGCQCLSSKPYDNPISWFGGHRLPQSPTRLATAGTVRVRYFLSMVASYPSSKACIIIALHLFPNSVDSASPRFVMCSPESYKPLGIIIHQPLEWIRYHAASCPHYSSDIF